MSFILDALKKSETDRQRQAAPALFEVKVAAPRRKFPLWAVGLAVLLGVNVLVLGWLLLRRPGNSAAPLAQAAPAAAQNVAQPMAANSAPPGMVTVPATWCVTMRGSGRRWWRVGSTGCGRSSGKTCRPRSPEVSRRLRM